MEMAGVSDRVHMTCHEPPGWMHAQHTGIHKGGREVFCTHIPDLA